MRQHVWVGLVLVLFGDSSLTAQETPRGSSNKSEFINDELFARCLLHNEIKSEYFFSELGLLDAQVQKLRKSIDRFRNETTIAYQRRNLYLMKDQVGQEILEEFKIELADLKECEAKVADIQKRFLQELDENLLAHQVKRLRQVALQRFYQVSSGISVLDVPQMLAGSPPLSKQQARLIETQSNQMRKEYLKYKVDLSNELWKQIQSKLPDQLQREVKEKIGRRSDKSEGLLLEFQDNGGDR